MGHDTLISGSTSVFEGIVEKKQPVRGMLALSINKFFVSLLLQFVVDVLLHDLNFGNFICSSLFGTLFDLLHGIFELGLLQFSLSDAHVPTVKEHCRDDSCKDCSLDEACVLTHTIL